MAKKFRRILYPLITEIFDFLFLVHGRPLLACGRNRSYYKSYLDLDHVQFKNKDFSIMSL